MANNTAIRVDGQVLRLGFFGCPGGRELVRCSWKGKHYLRAPKLTVVDCPSCGSRHQVSLMWRWPESELEWKQAEVKLPHGDVRT